MAQREMEEVVVEANDTEGSWRKGEQYTKK